MDIEDVGSKKIAQIKTIMMICVVLGHACVVYANKDGVMWGGISPRYESIFWGYMNKFLALFHTQTFAMASGYLFYYNRYELRKYRTMKDDVIRRFKQLIVPYVIVSVCWAIPWEIWTSGLQVKDVLGDFFLGKNPAQLWFLLMLFGVYLVFYFGSDRILEMPVAIGVLFFLMISYMSSLLGKILPLDIWQIGRILKYLLFFYIGLIFRKKKVMIQRKADPILPSIAYICTFCLFLFFQNQHGVMRYMSTLLSPICSILGIMMVCSLVSFFWSDRCENIGGLKKMIRDSTMGVYLIHQQIVYVVFRFFNCDMFCPTIVVIATFFVTLVISLAIVSVLRKYRITKMIF